MNAEIFQGKLKEISGELRKKWGELTDDEIERTKGNSQALAGLVQQKYGMKKEEAEREVKTVFGDLEKKYSQSFSDKVNEKIEKIKDKFSH